MALFSVLTIKCSREEEALEWKDTIQKVLNESGKVWREEKRFGSSYPIRRNGHCQWYKQIFPIQLN